MKKIDQKILKSASQVKTETSPNRIARKKRLGSKTRRKNQALPLDETSSTLIFENSAVGIFILDLNRFILEANFTSKKILGYDIEELRSMRVEDLSHSKDRATSRILFQDLAEGKTESYQTTLRALRKNGQTLWIRLSTSRSRDSKKSQKIAIMIIEDITEAKRAEETLRKSEVLFEQAERTESMGRYTSGIAHDFNNLLTGIMGYSDLIMNRLRPDNPLTPYVERIRKASEQGAMLTDQLLTLARRRSLTPVIIDLNNMIQNLEGLLRRTIDEKIELLTDLVDPLVYIKANPSQIEQVLINVVLNAKDAMPEGGTLTIKTANVHPDDNAIQDRLDGPAGPYVTLGISDTGIGMDSRTQAQIFDPFFTTKDSEEAAGLGLYTVDRIVRRLGGHIKLKSFPEEGTTLLIFFPQIKGGHQGADSSEILDDFFFGKETVLVVEDDENVLQPTCEVLKEKGYKVLAAEDGEKAIEISKNHKSEIHLLITDILMPNISGPDLADQLTTQRSHIKILFMSGYTRRAIEQMKALDPEVPFLIKPFSPNALVQKVREVLDQTASTTH